MTIEPFYLQFSDYMPSYKVTSIPSISRFGAFFLITFNEGVMQPYDKDYTDENRCNQMIAKIKR